MSSISGTDTTGRCSILSVIPMVATHLEWREVNSSIKEVNGVVHENDIKKWQTRSDRRREDFNIFTIYFGDFRQRINDYLREP